jgi:hypothetical protein
MNQCQQQQMQQFPQANCACAGNMNFGCQRVNNCSNAFMGRPCSHLNQGLSSFAMAGAGPGGSFALAGNNGSFGNNLFNPPYGGNQFGHGVQFPPMLPGLPMPGVSLSLGVSLTA